MWAVGGGGGGTRQTRGQVASGDNLLDGYRFLGQRILLIALMPAFGTCACEHCGSHEENESGSLAFWRTPFISIDLELWRYLEAHGSPSGIPRFLASILVEVNPDDDEIAAAAQLHHYYLEPCLFKHKIVWSIWAPSDRVCMTDMWGSFSVTSWRVMRFVHCVPYIYVLMSCTSTGRGRKLTETHRRVNGAFFSAVL